MNKYIDAEKLIAEIDKKWKELADKNVKIGGGKYDIEISTYLSIKNIITSLQQEQMEADLEKEPKVDLEKKLSGWMGHYAYENGGEYPGAIDIAHHFYELGLKARKEE